MSRVYFLIFYVTVRPFPKKPKVSMLEDEVKKQNPKKSGFVF